MLEVKTDSVIQLLTVSRIAFGGSLATNTNNDSRKSTGSATKLVRKNRRDYCKYCTTHKSKIFRHLVKMHSNEAEVMELIRAHKAKDPAFRALRERLRLKFNAEAKLSPSKVSGASTSQVGYCTPRYGCVYCKQEYATTSLSRHCQMYCTQKQFVPEEDRLAKNSRLYVKLGRYNSMPLEWSKEVRLVFANMRDGPVTDAIKTDPTLFRYFDYNVRYYFPIDCIKTAKQNLQILANLFLYCKQGLSVVSFLELLQPELFEALFGCVRTFSGRDVCERMKKPYKTKKGVEQLRGMIAKEILYWARHDVDMEAQLILTQRLMESEFHMLSRHAMDAVKNSKFNKVPMLPLFEDLKKLNTYLDGVLEKYSNPCQTPVDYSLLCRALLTKIIVFNRKRPGEIHRLKWHTVEDAERKNHLKPNSDIYETLDNVSKYLVKSMFRIEFLGKRGGRNAALLTPAMVRALRKLKLYHSKFVTSGSDLVFARPGNFTTPFQGTTALKYFAVMANVDQPTVFTATRLRKHLATMSQALHLSDNGDITDIAAFMQHQPEVHRHHYQLPTDTTQKFKITKYLWKVNFGHENLDEGQFEEDAMIDVGEPRRRWQRQSAAAESDSNSDQSSAGMPS